MRWGDDGDDLPKTRTIVASDNQVSNGFVKEGNSLPYVFEEQAPDSGQRKRSSKILPVCGVCGKRFVCVTTMKRHLVTHTGEKPFSCKICGKQYTQKGNLRVHERTHRNDRPFECQVCQQRFYRKEPMQKHQWRQHGIVHFKASKPSTDNALYNSIVDKIRQHSLLAESSSRGHTLSRSPVPNGEATLPSEQPSAAVLAVAAALNMTNKDFTRLEDAKNSPDEPVSTEEGETRSPLQLKKMLAQVYHQREIRLLEDRQDEAKMVECPCGFVFNVLDPQNFRCPKCDLKSTEVIADPLECLGCSKVFPNLLASNAHQMWLDQDPERPFRCCQCGLVFTEKTLLQKHQLNTHRRNQPQKAQYENAQPLDLSGSIKRETTSFLSRTLDLRVNNDLPSPKKAKTSDTTTSLTWLKDSRTTWLDTRDTVRQLEREPNARTV